MNDRRNALYHALRRRVRRVARLATGLPASFLLDPRKALAGPVPPPPNPRAQSSFSIPRSKEIRSTQTLRGRHDRHPRLAATSGIAHSTAASMAASPCGSARGRGAPPCLG